MFLSSVKMQITLLAIIIYIALNYFMARRMKTDSHKVYSVLLVDGIVYMIFDIVTVYTVNHLEAVSPVINRLAHDIFLASMTLFLYLVYVYSLIMVKGTSVKVYKTAKIWAVSWIIMAVLIFVLPLDYIEGEVTNYSMGPAAYIAYVATILYFVMACVLVFKNYRKINIQRRRLLYLAYGVQFLVLAIMMIQPQSLISSCAVTFIVIAYYLTIESPDMHLIEQLELEKQSAEKANRAKSDFLAKMSHEIRTPINGVMGMTELIIRETKEKETKKLSNDILVSANSLLEIINEILDSSKIESGKMLIDPVEYSMKSIVTDVENITKVRAKEKALEVEFKVDEKIPMKLWGDDLRIKEVLTNLTTNAVKYTQKGSVKVLVSCHSIKDGNAEIYFEVKDTGIGIKQEDIPRLYADFERIEEKSTRYVQGTGLGLSITIQLLKLMDSELKVESEYGKGSVFSFILKQKIIDGAPMGDYKKLEEKEVDLPVVNYEAPNARLLVVDDNATNLKVFRGLLKRTKIQIETAESAAEGLKILKENDFDIIFLDHMMPEMDGIAMFHKMLETDRERFEKIPVIMLTANAIVGAREEYLSEGFTDFLTKPILPGSLDKMLLTYLPKELIVDKSEKNEEGTDKGKSKVKSSGKEYRGGEDKIAVELKRSDRMKSNGEVKSSGEIKSGENDIKSGAVSVKYINKENGINFCGGSEELYMEILEEYLKEAKERKEKLNEYYANKNYSDYLIQIHALKSTSRNVGAEKLSDMARELEGAVKALTEEEAVSENKAFLENNHESCMKAFEIVLEEIRKMIY